MLIVGSPSPYTGRIDPECLALCDAINEIPGIETRESCCGHGENEFHVWITVHYWEHVPTLLYWLDG
jgi:hypothetical protein